jgi:L-seryl-tRNA(Ser) seleniumtransferase
METRPPNRQRRLQEIPAVREILDRPELRRLQEEKGVARWTLRKAVRSVLERQRDELLAGKREKADDPKTMEWEILKEIERLQRKSLRPVINATGVIVHTNLGRAPLPEEALDALREVAKGYSNLEYDLEKGGRGLRYRHLEGLLCELTGAEAALVVNNNAAAVLLALRVLARGREVIVSRGELVEIGGSFRVPDILSESGATLVEVGTTNRTRLSDYEKAIGPSTGLLLKVHPSNYRIQGFTQEVPLEELVSLGRRSGLAVMQDLGSGCMMDHRILGLSPGEPSVREVVASGLDLVTFSGDKLLGGPQAGILLGRKPVMQAVQTHPLIRALRMDKLTLAALESTLLLYREPQTARKKIPVLAMLGEGRETLRRRARGLAARLKEEAPADFSFRVCDATARAGGGSLPAEGLAGAAVAVKSSSHPSQEILTRLRHAPVPVIARIEKDEVLLDVRTVRKGEAGLVVRAFREGFGSQTS